LAHPAIAEIMAKAGFEWLAIDLEHTSITHREAEDLIRVIDLCGVSPLVRLTSNNPNQIKRMMDAGAHGIIVPTVNTKEQAEAAVAAVYYPPRGRRGVGLARAQGYGANFEGYQKWLNDSPVVIVQIEHFEAVQNLAEILSVDGVDGYMVGPYDLSASLGVPGQFEHPEVLKALKTLEKTAKTSQKPGGFHVVEPDVELLEKRMDAGFKFLAFSTDMRLIDSSCRSNLSKIRLKVQNCKK
jgi:2-keto-3-deoxy-L-rhamnonate aldolase RhmA